MTDSEALVAFIKARLDEDEQTARAASKHSADWREDSSWLTDMLDPLPSQRRERPTGWMPMIEPEDIVHIARHDPSRVLREVANGRRLVEVYERALADNEVNSENFVRLTKAPDWAHDGAEYVRVKTQGWVLQGRRDVAEYAVRRLAGAWSDHPDYNPDWSTDDGR